MYVYIHIYVYVYIDIRNRKRYISIGMSLPTNQINVRARSINRACIFYLGEQKAFRGESILTSRSVGAGLVYEIMFLRRITQHRGSAAGRLMQERSLGQENINAHAL